METEFWDQFAASPDGVPVCPPHFVTTAIAGWTIARHPQLPLHPVTEPGGPAVGVVLGYLLTDAGLLPNGAAVPIDAWPANDAALSAWLDSLRGRFAVLLNGPAGPQTLLDSGGTLAAVFRVDRAVVGSTSTLANYDHLADFVARRSVAEPVGANKFFPAGLTGSDNTKRLMPNHILDVKRATQRRYWPFRVEAEAVGRRGMLKAADEIVTFIRRDLMAAAKVGPIHAGLTAGRDSRVLLACLRPVVDGIHFHTFDYGTEEKAGDLESAVELAELLGLRHGTLSLNVPTEQMKDDYRVRTGFDFNTGKTCDFYDAWMRHLPRTAVTINGYCGEIGRGYYYKSSIPTKRPTAPELLGLMKLPATEPFVSAVDTWLGGLPAFVGPALALDLAYWELRAGGWALPQMYGAAPSRLYLTPLGHRYVIKRMLQIPADLRRRQYVPHLLVAWAWNRASGIPFNGNIRASESVFGSMRRHVRRAADYAMMIV